MGIETNFDGIGPATPFVLVPPGEYLVRVMEAKESASSAGLPGFRLLLEIVGGECAGGELRDWLSLAPKALPFTRQKLEALGITIPAGPWVLTEQHLLNARATVVVREGTFEGRDGPMKTAEVKAYKPAVSLGTATTASAHDDGIPF